jgi:hypothetical protein
LKRFIRAVLGLAAIASALSGCEPSAPSDSESKSAPPVAGPNRRIMANEKYKELIGKDGKPLWTPGKAMTPPAEKGKP